ncbi:MAG TPA: DUF5666 domain-containing protein [Caldisericia bacterium]|nr:DUF5666 domain-containing protein [Caldisericia bacterium]HPF48711.1 DUF5666 domain-containing protein [Caldisericia bacterium]HPI83629.1 DUF5666 domain-containing protein [Caldisericia bacterium]HPQ93166.1 DUF5666 domain-containing protein [Caldisericia bacterium]HRV75001.1 DUF5666 domain-containing protein [Caldisericia bacterium]
MNKKTLMIAALVGILVGSGVALAATEAVDIWGRVDSIDTSANTISVTNNRTGDYTLHITDSTKLTVNGETATISDITVPANVRGTAEKVDDTNYNGVELSFTSCPGTGGGAGGGVGGGPGDGSCPLGYIGGFITEVNTSDRSFEVNCRKLGVVTVVLADGATITKDGAEIGISDVKVDDFIRFEADEQDDGTYLASSAEVSEAGTRPGGGSGKGGNQGKPGRGGCGGGGCGGNR